MVTQDIKLPERSPRCYSKRITRGSESSYVQEIPKFKLGLSLPLDGLRGISILLVLVAHIQLLEPRFKVLLTGGLLGVDVFFVISGFLITSLLLEEQNAFGTINLKRFYMRRALRLLPALITLVLVTCAMGLAIGSLTTVGLTGFRLLSIVGYFMNWVRAFESPRPWFLGHLWSLSVEEQFYLLWPAVLVLLFGIKRPRKSILSVLLAALGLSLLLKPLLYLRGANVQRLFFASDTRAEPILIGCLLAVVVHWWQARAFLRHKANAWLALAVSVVLLTTADRDFETIYYLGGLTVFAVAIATIILRIILDPSSKIASVLSSPSLVWIGKRSYGIYLWHWPVFKLSRMIVPTDSAAFLLMALTATFSIAALSYGLIEAPFLRIKSRLASEPDNESRRKTARLSPTVRLSV